ncbi:MFS monocarboxylate transporter [Myriangium duriaei CBS 260.36]|uniref:MFS monocarboxylate transporter n=1 Tax=Myriangium duriaei CBS 260.36 TaxID=1168546 RepID=A0A9P4ISY7_9PEZI|nr:MFS monocarboxylate transporter [Myriangium duriaei CBS 260.36]
MYLSAPPVAWMIARWPYSRKYFFWIGFCLTVVSLIAASFARSTAGLLATQGVIYAIGGVALYFPAISLLDEWFIAKKGMAFGLMWAGTGTSGAVVPFLMQWLLNKYGHATALRVWTIIFSVLVIPSLLVSKPRLPVTPANRVRPTDWSFLKSTSFWFFEAGVIFQGLGFFLPQLWIPSFAASFGFPSYAGPLALSLYNVFAIAGSILTGMLVDRLHVTTAIAIATLGSAVASFVLWGLGTSQPMFYIFTLAWGLFAGGYSTTWSGCAVALRRSGFQNLDTPSVVSLFAAGKGIGSIVSGPLSESLLHLGPIGDARFVYGTSYGNLVVFTGVAAVLGGTACAGRMFRLV